MGFGLPKTQLGAPRIDFKGSKSHSQSASKCGSVKQMAEREYNVPPEMDLNFQRQSRPCFTSDLSETLAMPTCFIVLETVMELGFR